MVTTHGQDDVIALQGIGEGKEWDQSKVLQRFTREGLAVCGGEG